MLMGLLDATQREEPGTMLRPSSRVAPITACLPVRPLVGWVEVQAETEGSYEMAEIVRVGGQEFKRRNIFGVWLGLPLITIGIYTFVWYYKINDEARRYLADDTIRPGVSVLALTLGWVILLPPFISIFRTAERVRRMQEHAGIASRIEPVLALVAVFFFSLWTLYIQEMLNRIWDAYLGGGSVGQQNPVPPTAVAPPVPPPPPAPEA